MISDLLYSFVSQVSAVQASEFFLQLMTAFFVLAVVLRLLKKSRLFTDSCPALLTSLGILGTFVGIIIGLLEFDISQLDASVASLLEGLKTAFITSVFGIALAFIYRIFSQCVRYSAEADDAVTPKDMLQALNSMKQALAESSARQEQFSSEVSANLVGELKLIVAEFNQRVETEFAGNLQHMSASFKGFSQEFGVLSSSCQELYQSLATLVNSSHDNAQQMAEMGVKLNHLNEHFGSYFSQMEQLFALLHQTNSQFSGLNDKLLDYSARSLEVVNSVPEMNAKVELFNENIAQLTEVTSQTVKGSLVGLAEQSQQLGMHIEQVAQAFHAVSHVDENILQGFIEKGVSAYHSSVAEISERQVRMHQEFVHSLDEIIQSSFSKIQLSAEQQQAQIEQRLEHEVDAVMASMGQALAAISGQFTRDYQQLIAQMQRVLERSREVA